MELDEMLELVFATEGEERLAFTKRQFEKVTEEFKRIGVDAQNRGAIVLEIVKLFLRADQRTSFEEYTFLSELLGLNMSYDAFRSKIRAPQPEDYEETIEAIVKGFTYEGRVAFCYFGLCLIESDETMNPEERALIEHVVNALLGRART